MTAADAKSNVRTPSQKRSTGGLYADVWSNQKCARVAALATQGCSCVAIAKILNDGTTQNQIASMVLEWGISLRSTDPRQTYADVPVPLAAKHRTTLAMEAERRGLELPALLQKVAVMVCRDDLFGAVLD